MTLPPRALVTGAARGIGAEVSRQLAAAGYRVLVAARDPQQARTHVDRLTGEAYDAEPVPLDLADPASVAALSDALADRPLHVLVNNAAAFADWQERPSTADLDATAAVLEVNVLGTWRVIQTCLPALRRADTARVVNVGSGAGSFGDPQFGLTTGPAAVSYAVSKAALHALTVKLAAELADTPVLVNAVDPGLTATAPGMETMGARPVSEGAASVVWAATLPDDGPRGGLYRDGVPLAW